VLKVALDTKKIKSRFDSKFSFWIACIWCYKKIAHLSISFFSVS
jgi:hypothetical protein